VKEYLDLAAAFINRVGFPIFIAIVLLWRDDKRHAENLQAMRDLVHTVKDQHLARHCKTVSDRLTHRPRSRRQRDKRR
jgi:hypothetical protein